MAKEHGGWYRESQRHSLASRGVRTGHKRRPRTPRQTVDLDKNKRVSVKGIADWYNTDLETARRIYDWIKVNRPDHLYSQHVAIGISGSSYIPEPKDVEDACDALGIPRYERKIIAGRGEAGDMNWGVKSGGVPNAKLDQWEKELKKHIGEEVYLSGGGGYGVDLVKLVGVRKDVWDPKTGKMGLRAELEWLDEQPFRHKKGERFDPWMDSWQVSVLEQVN